MKSILDTIKEMEGAATPANTMGMGNPMPATDTAPGSEPICTKCKKKKKPVKESIFDAEEKIETFDKAMIEDWLEKNASGSGIKVNDDLTIDANYLVIDLKEPLPDNMVLGKVNFFKYRVDLPIDEVVLDMPKKSTKIYIETYDVDSIIIAGDINCEEFKIFGDAMKITLPKKFKCESFNLRDSHAHRINGIKNIKATELQFPSEFLRIYLQETLKLPTNASIYIRGSRL